MREEIQYTIKGWTSCPCPRQFISTLRYIYIYLYEEEEEKGNEAYIMTHEQHQHHQPINNQTNHTINTEQH